MNFNSPDQDLLKPDLFPFLQRKPIILYTNSTLEQALRTMERNPTGTVIISDHEGHLVGILTHRDLCTNTVLQDHNLQIPVSEIMTDELVTVDENTSLPAVISLMQENGIRRIPVVQKTHGGRQRCLGMITLDDLLIQSAISLEDAAKVLKNQLQYIQSHRMHSSINTKSEARKEQHFESFIKHVSEHTGLMKDSSEQLTYFMLTSLVRSLEPSVAARFIAQLPELIHSDLLDLKAGPDPSIDSEFLTTGVAGRFQISAEKSEEILQKFWTVLKRHISTGEVKNLLSRLPRDLCSLFEADSKSSRAS